MPLESLLARGYWTEDVPADLAVEAVEAAGPGRDWPGMAPPVTTPHVARTDVHYDDNDRVVEIHEFDEAGNSIRSAYAPPPDPHVESLRYRFARVEDDDYSTSFEGATPVEHESSGFRIELGDGVATVEMREHHAVVESARTAVEPMLKAWEIDHALRVGRPEFRFEFESAEVVERDPGLDPPEGDVRRVYHRGLVDGGVTLDGQLRSSVSRGSYPAPPVAFAWTPDVETLSIRWQAYLAGKESLQTMAYACLTLLERQGKRPGAAAFYGISRNVLDKVGHLSDEGDERTARKLDRERQRRPLTDAERLWLEEAVRALIRRVGEVAAEGSTASLPKLTLADLPDLPDL